MTDHSNTVTFLSPEYLVEYHRCLSRLDLPADFSAAIQYVITDSPRGDVSYFLRIADGEVLQVEHGVLSEPSVTVHLPYETSYRVVQGTLEPATALASGGLRFEGDPGTIQQIQQVLRNEDRSDLDELRAVTVF